MEQWRAIKNYEGLYEVSDQGRVRRIARNIVDSKGVSRHVSEMVMKEGDLHEVALHKDGKYETWMVRSLVAEAFLGVPYGTSLTHIDRDYSNSKLSNLMLTSEYRFIDPDWRDIPGWEGLYQASRYGQIRSLDRYVITSSGKYRFCAGVTRSMDKSKDGYYQVCLYNQSINKVKTANAHVFIAQAWIPNPENKPTVNHIDGNKFNNCIENLEWATYSEQQQHVKRTGLRHKPWWSLDQNGPVGGDWNSKRSIRVRCIETGVEYESMSAAAEAIGSTASEVKFSVDNHNMCKGLHFVKASDPDYKFGVESLDGEIWRPIPGFEGRYELSNFKRIKSVERLVNTSNGNSRTVPEKILSFKGNIQLTNSNGCQIGVKMDDMYMQVFGNTQKKLFNIG